MEQKRLEARMRQTPALIQPSSGSGSGGAGGGLHVGLAGGGNAGRGIALELDQRWALLGMSETGKTTFARKLVTDGYRRFRPWAPVYVFDSKGTDFNDWPGRIEAEEPPDPREIVDGFQVWAPPGIRVDAKLTDAWLTGILRQPGGAVALIDELTHTTKKPERPQGYPGGLEVYAKTGRGMNKALIALSQGIAGAPPDVFWQASHGVRFGLERPYDKRLANEWMGFYDKAEHEPGNKHGFWFVRPLTRPKKPWEYRGYQEFFGL